jgi:DNA topoisomerase-1
MENEAAEVITEETAAASPVQAAEPAPQKQKKTAAKKPAAKKPAAKTAKKTTSKKTAKPSGKLVIVESPAKAKTIQKYLGKGYQVLASMGHIRDLPKSRLAVDVENGFKPEYIDIRGKGQLRNELKKAAKKSSFVYLATDPDREGEAISWHLSNMLGLDNEQENRVTFNEITKSGIKNGMAAPRHIDINLVNAQQTRRILDRLVGYKLSPFLWKTVKPGLSAGRVQSVVVKLIVDREREIQAFEQEEYWSIDAKLSTARSKKQFPAKLSSYQGKKVEIPNEEQANKILAELEGQDFVIGEIKKGVKKKVPAPPFITSTLQQEASRRLGFQAKRTMKAAQELYEGIDLPKMGAVGLITYMRTDSLRISDEAAQGAREYITGKYGEQYLPEKTRVYKKKTNTQDAHEAIRPTMPSMTPEQVKESLTLDQYKLYKLVWERFIASQMADALLDTVSATINCGEYAFKASGYSVRFDGFTVLYEESRDVPEEKTPALPELLEGETLKLNALEPNQHFTQPPARYTEAAIIKALEENGIGRPSTYAPTITTVIQRGYVEREGKSLVPTQLGEVTNQLMEEQFSSIVNVDFTAEMETNLDRVEEGKADWVQTLGDFYGEFEQNLKEAEKKMEGMKLEVPDEVTDVICENCGRNMVVKMGRYGKFLACPGYPECKNTKKIVQETPGTCPVCGGKIHAKKSKKGKTYFGCEHNPQCQFMTWDKPVADLCPKCGSTLFQKAGRGGKLHCLKEGCGYEKE